MIEVSDVNYWKRMGYYDGLLYCSLLEIGGKNDWRLPSCFNEVIANMTEEVRHNIRMGGTLWYGSDSKYADNKNSFRWWVIPVRDV